MDSSLIDLLTKAERVGIIAQLIVALIGGYRGWWIWGPVHRAILEAYEKRLEEKQREINEWKEFAQKGTFLASKAVDLAERRKPSVTRSHEEP